MKLIDLNDGRGFTLTELKREWAAFHKEDHWNHTADFRTELFEILMATINGRNDLVITGLTPREADRLVRRLRTML